MATTVSIVARRKPAPLAAPEVRKLVRATLRLAGRAGAPAVTVLFADDREVHDLNLRYRGKDKPTDVLSFPAEGPFPPGEETLGDIVISVETAAAQARRRTRSLDSELRVLLIHGVLHLLGYDHETDDGEMESLEKAIRREIPGVVFRPAASAAKRAVPAGTHKRGRA